MLLVLLLSHQVAYCKRMFGWFSPKIKLWATFNEPTCFAFVGYIASLWCPGKLMKFTLGGEVGVGAEGGGARGEAVLISFGWRGGCDRRGAVVADHFTLGHNHTLIG